MKIHVFLIEDDRVLGNCLIRMFRKQPDFRIFVGSGDYEYHLRQTAIFKPDVILLDAILRHQNSFEVLDRIKSKIPGAKVIIIGAIPWQSEILEFIKAGVSGFIVRAATFETVLKTVRLVLNGGKILPPQLTDSLFTQINTDAVKIGKTRLSGAPLTKREWEVVFLIGEALGNKEIAQRLHLATYTVKSHVHNILNKLSLHTRLEIASFAHTREIPGSQIPVAMSKA